MLRFNLRPLFKARGIERPYTFLVKIGFTPHSAHLLLNPKSTVLKLDYVERLCLHLNCEPSDLMMWAPDKNTVVADNHPLQNLRTTEEVDSLKLLHELPYKQLLEFGKKVKDGGVV